MPLEQRKLAPTMDTSAVKEHAEQIKAYLRAQKQVAEARDDLVAHVNGAWEAATRYPLSARETITVRRFLRQLDLAVVLEAIDIAVSRGVDRPFAYMCGICWKQIRVLAEPPPPTNSDSTASPDAVQDDDDSHDYDWGDGTTLSTIDSMNETTVRLVDETLRRSVCELHFSLDDVGVLLGTLHPVRRKREGRLAGDSSVLITSLPDSPAARQALCNLAGISVILGKSLLFVPWRSVQRLVERDSTGTWLKVWTLSPRTHWATLVESGDGVQVAQGPGVGQ